MAQERAGAGGRVRGGDRGSGGDRGGDGDRGGGRETIVLFSRIWS